MMFSRRPWTCQALRIRRMATISTILPRMILPIFEMQHGTDILILPRLHWHTTAAWCIMIITPVMPASSSMLSETLVSLYSFERGFDSGFLAWEVRIKIHLDGLPEQPGRPYLQVRDSERLLIFTICNDHDHDLEKKSPLLLVDISHQLNSYGFSIENANMDYFTQHQRINHRHL